MPAIRCCLSLLLVAWVYCRPTLAVDIERAPIDYTKTAPNDAISRLQTVLDESKQSLAFDNKWGYLPALLKALEVPQSSQVLVYSKTSFQRNKIAPYRPRAVYFNDQVYVGYCQGGDVLEISVADPQLGTNFYSLDQTVVDKPRFVRHTDNCLICHGSSRLEGLPGHLLRSVMTDASGSPLLTLGSQFVDQTTPFEKRWGGWYVTGTHGENRHQGNIIVRGRVERPEDIDLTPGQNLAKLDKLFDTDHYVTPHSDIVALLVMEHQTGMHNLLARASINTRAALHDERQMNRDLGKPEDHRWPSTDSRIKDAVEPLLRYTLMSEAAVWQGPVSGGNNYAAEFAARGPFDPQHRSLRELDLNGRLFKYPCSYLIYGPEFAGLPAEARSLFLKRLHQVLTADKPEPAYAHLSAADRQAISEILTATWPPFTAKEPADQVTGE